MGCECNFNNIYLWSRPYGQEIACWEGLLLVRLRGRLGHCYLVPMGEGDHAAAVEALRRDAHAQGETLTFVCVTRSQRERLDALFPGGFVYEEDRDGWDYVYDIHRLADLSGKKFHGKRNHIHRFDEAYPDWMAEPITAENAGECAALERKWADEKGGGEGLSEESIALLEGLYLREGLGMEGLLIRAGGKVVAFSLGSLTTPDCFDTHFEKAEADIQGAYPVINREMARMVRERHPEVKWINREDDLGIEGLRKAKLSYYPDLLLEKFSARER